MSSEDQVYEDGTWELQAVFLRYKQREFSARFAQLGVILSIITAVQDTNESNTTRYVGGRKGKLFVPFVNPRFLLGDSIDELRLAAIPPNFSHAGEGVESFSLGILDEYGGIDTYPGVPVEKAEIVRDAATELLVARQHLIPDVDYSLLFIVNRRSEVAADPPEYHHP